MAAALAGFAGCGQRESGAGPAPARDGFDSSVRRPADNALGPTPAAAAASVATPAPAPSTAEKASIRARVQADPMLARSLPQGTAVYVSVYALDGPRLPLARTRLTLRDLPREVLLDDSMAPHPAFRLSRAAQVVVRAHVSSADQPTASSHDPQGTSDVVIPGAQPIDIHIAAQGDGRRVSGTPGAR